MSDPVCGYTFDGIRCRSRGPHRCHGRARHVLAFFTELLVHTKGDWAGRPFTPAGWQRERVLAPLFGEVIYDERRGRYVRRYRILYLSVARKNGKTELLAGVVLYLLIGDGEPGAEIYGLASDRDQAGLVYNVVIQMVRRSRALRDRLTVIASVQRVLDQTTGSVFAVSARDALGDLGLNPSGAYIDELLAQPDRDLYDTIRTGFGARAEPVLLLATTAENDPAGFPAQEREWSERVAADPGLDPERLVVIYRAPDDADWTRPSTWRKANPALGDFLDLRVLESECRTAVNNPAEERAFRQYRLNQPVNRVGRAVSIPAWDSCPPIEGDLAGQRCWAGLDLASTQDLASYALDFPQQDGTHAVLWRTFTPEKRVADLDRRTGGRATVWVADGLLTTTPGSTIEFDWIMRALREDAERYQIAEVGFDPWAAAYLSSQLTEQGMPMVAMHQSLSLMAPPTSELLRLIHSGRYRHGGNPLVRWQASNLVTRSDAAGNLRPDKERSADKIDGLVAGIMALDRALRAANADPEPDYATAGF